MNGFDRVGLWGTHFDADDALKFPWIKLCLRELERRSRGSDYEVFVWDNSQQPELRAIARGFGARVYPSDDELVSANASKGAGRLVVNHGASLHKLWSLVSEDFEYVMTLDTDAFPVRNGWIESLQQKLDHASLTGIWRDEMASRLQPFVHPSCLFARRQRLLQLVRPFSYVGVQDVGQRITLEITGAGETVAPLRRSNSRNPHFLIAGIYGDLVYHHAAGSRVPVFRMSEGEERDELVYTRLRTALFKDVDHVMAVLRGESDDDLGLDWERVEPWPKPVWVGIGPRQIEAAEDQQPQ